mmetsp:Transcript_7719/g.10082  ORF Transcript_7719/g.10082 Transcript_7719/m.10082 type:complete len:113 (+) Transcript_7719:390-728(+)|eukprot:scaffold55904_cov27-Tisochrysis_lutea.AAC.2
MRRLVGKVDDPMLTLTWDTPRRQPCPGRNFRRQLHARMGLKAWKFRDGTSRRCRRESEEGPGRIEIASAEGCNWSTVSSTGRAQVRWLEPPRAPPPQATRENGPSGPRSSRV